MGGAKNAVDLVFFYLLVRKSHTDLVSCKASEIFIRRCLPIDLYVSRLLCFIFFTGKKQGQPFGYAPEKWNVNNCLCLVIAKKHNIS